MKSNPDRLTRTESLLKIILLKMGKKCKDTDFLKAREKVNERTLNTNEVKSIEKWEQDRKK